MNVNFIRWSGVAAVLGGLIVGVGAFLNEPFTGQYLLGGLLIIIALIGILLVLRREGAARWGALGIVVALSGNFFFAIERFYALGGVLYGLGLVLLAIGALKTGVFPRWLPGLVLTGAAALLNSVATVVFGLAFVATGYALWTAYSASPAQPAA